MKNKVLSAYEKMMNEGKLKPLPKQKQRIDEIMKRTSKNTGSRLDELEKIINGFEKRIKSLESEMKRTKKSYPMIGPG